MNARTPKKSDTDLTQNDRTNTPPHTQKESPIDAIKNVLFFSILVLMIVLPIRIFVAKPFIVSGTSMFPTFDTWHYLIVDQLTYRFNEPERGDVIIFKYPRNPSRFFVKRIIALPGETIKIDGTTTIIKNTAQPEGFILAETYVTDEHKKNSHMSVTLGDNEYFVMGDNRKASADSRFWGPLEKDKIVGRAIVRLFPFSQIETFPGEITYPSQNK